MMLHRVIKVALINNEIDNSINALRYVLKYATLLDGQKKSEYGRLLVKLESAAGKVEKPEKDKVSSRKIQVSYE